MWIELLAGLFLLCTAPYARLSTLAQIVSKGDQGASLQTVSPITGRTWSLLLLMLGGFVLPGCRMIGQGNPLAVGLPTLTPITTRPPGAVLAAPLTTATVFPTETPIPTPAATATPVPHWYSVKYGDTWNGLAQQHGVPVETLLEMNHLEEEIVLEAGQHLAVPSHISVDLPQSYLIHDSEVVHGRAYVGWNTAEFLEEQGGALADYTETHQGEELSAAEIIDRVTLRYFVGPRPLLALMELTGGVVTGPGKRTESSSEEEEPAPLFFGREDPERPTLYTQLAHAGRKLMQGYYGQLEGRRDWIVLSNGVQARLHPGSNPGTAGTANILALLYEPDEFIDVLQNEAFQETYERLFGEQEGGGVMPPDGKQPYFALPWTKGEKWYFTGGPHGGYGDSRSGWGALDFAPPVRVGCQRSTYPVRAVAPGLVIGSAYGETWVDLDGDGDIRTGWVVFYMHLATEGRVTAGTWLETGDIVGYPSCEGGISTATHLHIARMYDGQWMPADRPIPFQLGPWTSEAIVGASYDGYLRNAHGQVLEACDCRNVALNQFPAAVSYDR